jgi:hypothetical protein
MFGWNRRLKVVEEAVREHDHAIKKNRQALTDLTSEVFRFLDKSEEGTAAKENKKNGYLEHD